MNGHSSSQPPIKFEHKKIVGGLGAIEQRDARLVLLGLQDAHRSHHSHPYGGTSQDRTGEYRVRILWLP